MSISTDLSIWIAAFLTVSVLSGVYKQNPVYKFAEALFIGVSAGYFACLWFISVLMPAFNDIANGRHLLIIPVLTGFLVFLPARKGKFGYHLVPAGFLVLIYATLNLIVYFEGFIYRMVFSAVDPLIIFNTDGSILWDMTVNSILSVAGVTSTLIFLFSRKYSYSDSVRSVGSVGRFYVLVAIGACFGYTLVSRIILLSGRIDFIVREFLGITF